MSKDSDISQNLRVSGVDVCAHAGTYERRGLRTLRWSDSRTRFTRAPRYLVDLPVQLYGARTEGGWAKGLMAERDQFGEGRGGKGRTGDAE